MTASGVHNRITSTCTLYDTTYRTLIRIPTHLPSEMARFSAGRWLWAFATALPPLSGATFAASWRLRTTAVPQFGRSLAASSQRDAAAASSDVSSSSNPCHDRACGFVGVVVVRAIRCRCRTPGWCVCGGGLAHRRTQCSRDRSRIAHADLHARARRAGGTLTTRPRSRQHMPTRPGSWRL